MNSKFKHFTYLLFFLNFIYSKSFSQAEITQYTIDAYEKEGWVYFGKNVFLYSENENLSGNPQVLSLDIDPDDSTAMLFLNEYDCKNNRIMMIAYKRYQNEPHIEKKHYLFEHKREWKYPLKTSINDFMLQAVCRKFGN